MIKWILPIYLSILCIILLSAILFGDKYSDYKFKKTYGYDYHEAIKELEK